MRLFALTFAITTYNRFEFLVEAMNRVLSARQADEEIVVVDGGSIDGTVEYLQKLRAEGRIDVFLSEPDRGQGHGINKAILLSSGELIKPINDDDLYDFAAIAEARRYMQARPNIDVLCSTVHVVDWEPTPHLIAHRIVADASLFPRRDRSFPFGDIGMMLRRSSLSLLGLFSPEIAWIDYEFSMRVTSTRATIACMDRTTGLRLTNDTSKSLRFWRQLEEERARINAYYLRPYKPGSVIDRLRGVKARCLSRYRNALRAKPDPNASFVSSRCPPAAEAFKIGENLLASVRQQEPAHTFRMSVRE